jgi:hypothetical protein
MSSSRPLICRLTTTSCPRFAHDAWDKHKTDHIQNAPTPFSKMSINSETVMSFRGGDSYIPVFGFSNDPTEHENFEDALIDPTLFQSTGFDMNATSAPFDSQKKMLPAL